MNAAPPPRPSPGPPPGPPPAEGARVAADLPEADEALLRDVAARIVAARMAVPAMMMLESVAPMNFVSASMLRLVSPAWQAVAPRSRIEQVAAILERRTAIPAFLRMIDEAEAARRRAAGPGGHPETPGSET